MTKLKKDLTLLGVWNILPIGTWTWSGDICIDQLKRLTGRKLGVFFYIKDDLNYECFVKKDIDLLQRDLEKLSPAAQVKYVKKITNDYYKKVVALEKQLKASENLTVESLSDKQLAKQIMKLGETWCKVTIQIWYAVLLDIWYPRADDRLNLKKLIAPARDHCGHLHAKSDKIEHKMNLEAAKRLGFAEREIAFMIQPEIADALNGKKYSKKILRDRSKECIEGNIKGKFKVFSGMDAKKLLREFNVPKIGKKSDVLKGTPACLGKVKGVARVILLDKDFSEFKDGEILVSLQTMIHYVLIMKKSSAIITEFGGLTSHAAIVSRELKKPCVVGISGLIATVKTGDVIEVDADHGIVEIIKNI